MHLSNLLPDFPRSFLQDCARLGRLDWLLIHKREGMRTEFSTRQETLAGDLRGDALVRKTLQTAKTGLGLCFLDCIGQLAARGPKLFRPTAEQCEAMENVEVRIPMTDYAQPYNVMIIEFPEAYRRSLEFRTNAVAQGRRTPRYVFLRHWPESTAFYSIARFLETDEEIAYFFQDRPEFPTAEDSLRTHHGQAGVDQVIISEAMTRVCMNLCLLLTNHPTRVAPSNPTALAKAQRRRDSNGTEGHNFEARTHVHVISFDQEIIVRRNATRRSEATGTHASPQPHWRRGHWRNQPCGIGRCETRRVLIPPVFVREDSFLGDLSETSVVYSNGDST